MRALLRSGEWVEIDTSCLFNNQYNTTEEYGNKRIFDGQIQRIEGDVRLGLGKCKYCGAIVKRGEEDKHFMEMEHKKTLCSMDDIETKSCFWKQRKYLGETEVKNEERTEIVDGVARTINVRTMEQKWVPHCAHEEKYGNCTYDEHEKYGIEWFTPDNCYFLKYPNGTDDYTLYDWIRNDWFPHIGNATILKYNQYPSKFGSYTLKLYLHSDEKTICYLILSNERKTIKFTYNPETKTYIVYDGIKGSPREVKKLLEEGKDDFGRNHPKCNEGVNDIVKKVVTNLYEKANKVKKGNE